MIPFSSRPYTCWTPLKHASPSSLFWEGTGKKEATLEVSCSLQQGFHKLAPLQNRTPLWRSTSAAQTPKKPKPNTANDRGPSMQNVLDPPCRSPIPRPTNSLQVGTLNANPLPHNLNTSVYSMREPFIFGAFSHATRSVWDAQQFVTDCICNSHAGAVACDAYTG